MKHTILKVLRNIQIYTADNSNGCVIGGHFFQFIIGVSIFYNYIHNIFTNEEKSHKDFLSKSNK